MAKKPGEKDEKAKKTMTRGQFLSLVWLGVGGLVAGEATLISLRYLKPQATSGFGGKVLAGKVGDFPVNSVTHNITGRFYVVRLDGGFLALYQRCPHLGCAVPWVDAENQFHCPCHGSLYSLEGEVTGGPAPRPMDLFPITIENGDEVWVDTSKPTQRTQFDPSQLTVI